MVGIVVWLVMGAFVGWLATMVMQPEGRHATVVNILLGIVGAGLGGVLLMFGLDGTSIHQGPSIYGLMVSLIGAVVILGVGNGLRGAHP